RTGRWVIGRGWRSARHHSRTGRNRPRGVPPSPSNLLARMPARPSTTKIAAGPASSTPRVGLPGRVRTRISDNDRPLIEVPPRAPLRPALAPLALLAPNALPPATPLHRNASDLRAGAAIPRVGLRA